MHFLPNNLLLHLHPVSVSLIGVGGTGSQMLSALARIDISLRKLNFPGLSIIIYDNDKITNNNVGRQMFSKFDIGEYKANVLVDRCNRFFDTEYYSIKKRFPYKDVDTTNIVISCVDNVKTRKSILRHFKKITEGSSQIKPYYWMDFGNTRKTGQVVLGTFNSIKQPEHPKAVPYLNTILDLFPNLQDDLETPSCSLAGALSEQDLFINTSLIPFGATILWNLLLNNYINVHGAFIDLENFIVKPLKC